MCPTVGVEGTPAGCGDYLLRHLGVDLILRLLKLTDALAAGLQDSRLRVTLVEVVRPLMPF